MATSSFESEEKRHSKTGASSCKRWANCPASVQLHRKVGDAPTNFYAAEGTRAHEVAEYMLRYTVSVRHKGALSGWIGSVKNVDGFDIPVTQEMIDGALLYHDIICEDMYYDNITTNIDGVEYPIGVLIEKEINLHSMGLHDCFGTVDAAYSTGDKIVVYDYKYGKGVSVDPENNYQMMYYALGLMASIPELNNPGIDVVLKIIQPRCPLNRPVKEWSTTTTELIEFHKMLVNALDLVESDNPPYSANDEWCRWCPGKLVCPEIKSRIYEMATVDVVDVIPAEKANHQILDVTRMSNLELSCLLKNEKLLDSFLKSGKEEARKRLDAGEEIPGYALKPKQGDRTWSANAEKDLYDAHGHAIYAAQKMLSPAQLEKALGIDVSSYVVRPSSLIIAETAKKHAQAAQKFDDLFV